MRPDFGRLRADVLSVQVSQMGRYSGIGMPRAKKKENAGGASSRSMNVVLKLRGVTAGRATDDDPRPPDAMALLLKSDRMQAELRQSRLRELECREDEARMNAEIFRLSGCIVVDCDAKILRVQRQLDAMMRMCERVPATSLKKENKRLLAENALLRQRQQYLKDRQTSVLERLKRATMLRETWERIELLLIEYG